LQDILKIVLKNSNMKKSYGCLKLKVCSIANAGKTSSSSGSY